MVVLLWSLCIQSYTMLSKIANTEIVDLAWKYLEPSEKCAVMMIVFSGWASVPLKKKEWLELHVLE